MKSSSPVIFVATTFLVFAANGLLLRCDYRLARLRPSIAWRNGLVTGVADHIRLGDPPFQHFGGEFVVTAEIVEAANVVDCFAIFY